MAVPYNEIYMEALTLKEHGQFNGVNHCAYKRCGSGASLLKVLMDQPGFGMVEKFKSLIPFEQSSGSSDPNTCVLMFPSIDKYLEVVDAIYGLTSDMPMRSVFPCNPTMDWSLNADFRQSFALGDAGWGSLAKKVATPSVDLANVLIDKSGDMSMHYDTAGAYVDVSSFLHGDPENMIEFDTFKPQERVIIYVNGWMSWSVDGARLVNRGVALIGAIMALESLGIGVQVELTFRGSNSWVGDNHGIWRSVSSIRVHESGTTLNAPRILAWTGHPGIIRGLMYGGTSCMWPGGSENHFPDGIYAPGVNIPGVKGIIIVPEGGDSAWATQESATKWAKSAFNKLMEDKEKQEAK